MPLLDPEGADPMEIVGVEVPAGPGAVEEMVLTYALEYRRLGWDRDRILATFRCPWYAPAYGAWLRLGEARTRALVEEALEPFASRPAAGEGA
jgi:hypothetical protein